MHCCVPSPHSLHSHVDFLAAKTAELDQNQTSNQDRRGSLTVVSHVPTYYQTTANTQLCKPLQQAQEATSSSDASPAIQKVRLINELIEKHKI